MTKAKPTEAAVSTAAQRQAADRGLTEAQVGTASELDLMLAGERVHVYRLVLDPAAPYLVFLHDSFGSIKLWGDFPAAVGRRTGCNVLVYDRAGYGQSAPFVTLERDNGYMEREADKLPSLLDQLGIRQAILFGQSDGGSIALMAAAKYGRYFIGVITEAAHTSVEEKNRQRIREASDSYENGRLRAKLLPYHGDNTDGVFHAWTGIWLSEEFRSWNIEHFLPRIECPCCAIQGAEDDYGTLEQLRTIAEGIVKAPVETHVIPGAKHTPHRTAREATEMIVTAAILKMKQQADPA